MNAGDIEVSADRLVQRMRERLAEAVTQVMILEIALEDALAKLAEKEEK